ncbi:hypothetical protein SAMN04487968_101454 [Nocardioides terrae]|uniref:Uncharacterized protein n=1 Tax=Nocardioides terrae TaxID=574651 RepID=A0A1I1DXQ9_9ACTN|nr:hypothetical protein [Nocardioides terrae]SFB77490.1 hypothetical protein SAMN04487968_101454 [Nocardioides terrae]
MLARDAVRAYVSDAVTSVSWAVREPGDFDLLVGPSSREESLLRARFSVR